MKRYLPIPILLVLGLCATLNFGCDKKSDMPPAAAPAPKAAPVEAAGAAVVSADKTSFTEVTSQLDPGGNFFLYLGTAQWLEKLSAKTESWRQKIESAPALSDENRANVDKGFDVLSDLIKSSGVETISGLGISSIAIEPGLYRNKMLLHHYPGQGDGFLWKLAGGSPHALTGLDFLPADTALAVFMDADLPLVWSTLQAEVAKAKFPPAQEFLDQLPKQFEAQTQLKWDQVVNSLGGEYGLVLTLDASNAVPIPLPAGLINIPEPGLLIVLKIKDDTIFNRIDTALKSNDQVIRSEKDGLKMRTMPLPIPLAVNVRPTVATGGGYLFIGSSDALVHEALAVKGGQKPGLKSTAEFKQLSQGIPTTGNQFAYMSTLFGQTVADVQKQIVSAQGANGGNAAQIEWMQTLFNNHMSHAYSVGMNTDSGCLTIGNSSQSAANMVLLPAVAVPAMLAAVSLPAFAKAKTTSQLNACINNLRVIDGAKTQWALEKNKKTGDVPTEEDLLPYITHGKFPHCPQGGVYTIGPIGETPKCTVPGHQLPE
ncbi:MAG TPA: hypothetical protein VGO57_04725 [Verrucomicrobiae bacterium]|jgi:hypothetical protein